MKCTFKRGAALAIGAICAVTAVVAPASAQDANGNWTEYHGDSRGWRFSPLDAINTGNVAKLKVAWIHQPGDITSGLQATPLVIDGVLYYIGANNRVYALDATTGKQVWEYLTELDPDHIKSIFATYNRGVAVSGGKVFFGTSDGRLIALDQKTGEAVWDTRLTEPKKCHGCNFTSPPTVAGDVVIIGKTGGDLAQRGQFYAVNAVDGKLLWTFDVLKDDPKSWPTEESKITGGGGAWLPGQYDAKTGLLYIGTSNPAPDFRTAARKGDNLYTSSVLAIEPKSGKLVWHHQEVPNDAWDFDSPYEMVMLKQDGKDVIMHLNKGGFVTVLDKKDGSVIHVWQMAENQNWADKVDSKTGEIIGRHEPLDSENKVFCPSALGVRSWNAGAYSPNTNLWYSNGYELCNHVKTGAPDIAKLAFSQPYYAMVEFGFDPPPGKQASAYLKAYDPLTGKVAWRVDYKNPGLGHVLATAGDLVFNGDVEGWLHAYDAKNGKELWNFNTGSGIRGGIISYKAGGKQYIAVTSGLGSLFPGFASGVFTDFKNVRGGAALITFTVE